MADNTRLFAGSGGDLIRTEEIGGAYKIAVSKIYIGSQGVDGGPVTTLNPLPTSIVGPVTVNGAVSVPGLVSVTGSVNVPGTVNVAGSVSVVGVTDVQGAVIARHTTGEVFQGAVALVPKRAAISATASGINRLVASVPGKQIRVLQYLLVSATPISVDFRTGEITSLTGVMALSANGGVAASLSTLGHFETMPGMDLNLNLSAAGNVAGHLTYIEV